MLGHLGACRVKFPTSTKVAKLYLRIKLLTSAFQKTYFQGHSRHLRTLKVKNPRKKVKGSMFDPAKSSKVKKRQKSSDPQFLV